MQQFDDKKGERRLLDIKNMKVKEVEDYYLQHLELSETQKKHKESQLKKKILQSKKAESCEWVLAIKSKEGKIIGKLEVWDTGAGTAYVTINLPNENWKRKYGVEAIKQFIKICKENKYFSTIELEKKNSIVRRYVTEYGVDFQISVA